MDQSLGMDPAQSMLDDLELAGVIADNDGVAEQAVLLDAAPERAFGGDLHRIGHDRERPDAEKRSLPICVQKPFLALWRAPVSSTVTQAAVVRPARSTACASPRKRSWRPIRRRTTCRFETAMPIASSISTSRGAMTWP